MGQRRLRTTALTVLRKLSLKHAQRQSRVSCARYKTILAKKTPHGTWRFIYCRTMRTKTASRKTHRKTWPEEYSTASYHVFLSLAEYFLIIPAGFSAWTDYRPRHTPETQSTCDL